MSESTLQHRSCMHITELQDHFEVIELLQLEAKVHKSLLFLLSELEDKDLNLITALNY